MNKNICKAAKNFIEAVKGNIDFLNVEEYINNIGYKIVFFNTPEGDMELARYGKTEDAKINKAFTYCGTAKIIFVNNNVSVESKLYLLLHEIGHILLEHIGDGKLYMKNEVLLDIEANAFAYAVLNPSRSKTPLYVGILLICFSFLGLSLRNGYTENNITTTHTPVLNQDEVLSHYDELVYVTKSGTKYHRSDCRYVKDKNCTTITINEAVNRYTPCSVCKP